LKDILGRAGVDIIIFKAHSVRGVSSIAASEKGVHIEDIFSYSRLEYRLYFQKVLLLSFTQEKVCSGFTSAM